jgi:hypothetical protein
LKGHVQEQLGENCHASAHAPSGKDWVRGWDDSWRYESLIHILNPDSLPQLMKICLLLTHSQYFDILSVATFDIALDTPVFIFVGLQEAARRIYSKC